MREQSLMVILSCVDAFANRAGTGNPAGVCLLYEPKDASWMQMVAREMNLSETAFLLMEKDGFSLQWFTPVTEVDLCGHATLASAHVLWERGYLEPTETARFYTKSGTLSAVKKNDWIEMDFPAEPEHAAPAPAGLIEALGVTPRYVGKNRFDYLIELATEEEVRDLKPDFSCLSTIPMRGVIVTSAAHNPDYDFVSRFFAPSAGVPEDPVTGSAHCCLCPFWEKRLHKTEFLAYQASGRGGF
ncbi:MAG: PhzF family phenazine biosynthesis protein, partial [Methanoregula sp.]